MSESKNELERDIKLEEGSIKEVDMRGSDPKTSKILENLKSHKCFNKYFKVEDLMNKSNSYGLEDQDGQFFGQIDKNNQKSGIGIKFFKSGEIYEGSWKQDSMHGNGSYKSINGDIFSGIFEKDKKSGFGLLTQSDRGSYEGEWLNDQRHGRGFWQDGKGNNYIGEWKFDEADGCGVLICQDGSRYEGEMKNSLRHGKGTEKLAFGDHYVGEFVNGLFEGQGEYTWANGSVYKGEFKIGQRHGYGQWKKKESDTNEIFEGFFLNDRRDGIGFVTYDNGNYFRGYFTAGMREGYGEMFWVSERVIYRGQWSNDKQTGLGELKFEEEKEDTAYLGYFSDGVLVELLDAQEFGSLIDKLDEYGAKMRREFNILEKTKNSEKGRDSQQKIFAHTLTVLYQRQRQSCLPKISEQQAANQRGVFNKRQRHSLPVSVKSREEESSEPVEIKAKEDISQLPDLSLYRRRKLQKRGRSAATEKDVFQKPKKSRKERAYNMLREEQDYARRRLENSPPKIHSSLPKEYKGEPRMNSLIRYSDKLKKKKDKGSKIWRPTGKFRGYIF